MTKQEAWNKLNSFGVAQISADIANEIAEGLGMNKRWTHYNEETEEGDPSVSTTDIKQELQDQQMKASLGL